MSDEQPIQDSAFARQIQLLSRREGKVARQHVVEIRQWCHEFGDTSDEVVEIAFAEIDARLMADDRRQSAWPNYKDLKKGIQRAKRAVLERANWAPAELSQYEAKRSHEAVYATQWYVEALARYKSILHAPRGSMADKRAAVKDQWLMDMREADSTFGQAV